MLVDINLLSKKKKKGPIFLLMALVIMIGIAAIALFIWNVYESQQAKALQLQQELAIQKEVKAQLEVANNEQPEVKLLHELESAIQWADNHQYSTFLIMRNLSTLLPERGFIKEFATEESGKVLLKVQFDSSREAAFYLKSMSNSTFITSTKLLTIDTEKLEVYNANETDHPPEHVLPRYVASYEVIVNQDAVQIAMEEGKVKE